MGYYVADANGVLGDLASGGGLKAFSEWAPSYGPIRNFLRDGTTIRPVDLAVALESEKADDPKVDATRRELAAFARRAEELLILSDGGTDD
jgi:hypothetical protein